MSRALLVLNAGSSSVKFQFFTLGDGLPLRAAGKVADIGGTPRFYVTETGGEKSETALPPGASHEDAITAILHWVEAHEQGGPLAAAGHRIVHGGNAFTAPCRVTPEVMARLQALTPLAPLHQPHNLAAIAILQRLRPDVPQIACFDTAFHAGEDALHTCYALPRAVREKGVRRYGFHGLSYEWIARELARTHPDIAKGRVIAAHLGNGASLCALMNGRSVDTTMGMTALDGLPMGTRCGSLDPGAILYMLEALGLSTPEVERLLYHESGLKGLSGLTHDVAALLQSQDPQARFALDYFALRVAQFAGQLAVSLGGVDALVFTGGIGENAKEIRTAVQTRLAFLGAPRALVIPANEERMIAIHTAACLGITA